MLRVGCSPPFFSSFFARQRKPVREVLLVLGVAQTGLVSQADAVFCPIGCISHDACLRLKHLCKRHRKAFIPLRSAGLSGFVAALDAFIKQPNAPASAVIAAKDVELRSAPAR